MRPWLIPLVATCAACGSTAPLTPTNPASLESGTYVLRLEVGAGGFVSCLSMGSGASLVVEPAVLQLSGEAAGASWTGRATAGDLVVALETSGRSVVGTMRGTAAGTSGSSGITSGDVVLRDELRAPRHASGGVEGEVTFHNAPGVLCGPVSWTLTAR